MTEKIKAFFASKAIQALSMIIGLLSILLALLCFVAPLSREHWAVQSLGETSVQQISSLSMSITHYEPQRLRYLLTTESSGPTHDNLTRLLIQAKEEYGFKGLSIVYENDEKEILCLADVSNPEGDFSVGQEYNKDYMDERSMKDIQELLKSGGSANYIDDIYGNNLVLAFAPLIDSNNDEVLAVLCAEAPLRYTNFSEFYGIQLYQVAESLAAVFIVCFVCFFIGRSFSGEDDDKNEKNNSRWFNKPTVTQQESNVFIDPLDDVDPNDYL